MQEKKIWQLAVLAALAAIATARRPHYPDSRSERSLTSPLAPKPAKKDEVVGGATAGSAWVLFRADWGAVLRRIYQKMNDNRLLAVAAGVVFYGLLALFPTITAFVSLYGLVADPSTVHERLSLIAGILPQGALDILNEQLTRLTAHRSSALSIGFVGGLLFALWSANAGSKAIMDGLNVAYEETEKRTFVRLNLVALAFTLGAIFALVLALGAVVVAPIIFSHLGLGSALDTLVRIARWPVLLALVILGLTLLYRYGPSLSDPQWTWLFPGNVSAAIVWLAASAIFSWYIANFGNYDATYGSLGAAIGMMTWMWISTIVVLLGAELNAELERERKKADPFPRGVSSQDGSSKCALSSR
jgi:membrane protein